MNWVIDNSPKASLTSSTDFTSLGQAAIPRHGAQSFLKNMLLNLNGDLVYNSRSIIIFCFHEFNLDFPWFLIQFILLILHFNFRCYILIFCSFLRVALIFLSIPWKLNIKKIMTHFPMKFYKDNLIALLTGTCNSILGLIS